MNQLLFFTLVTIILVASFIVGHQSGTKIKNENDYFLGGRKMGFFYVFMTLLATQLGGGAIVGTAEAAYLHGWKAVSYSAGVALGMVFMACGIGAKFRKMNVSTVPEIFKNIYGSENLRIFSSILYIISMFILLIAIGVSARKYALSLGYDNKIIFIIFWGTVIAYTTSGGLTAVTQTDILQIIFVLLAFIITFIFFKTSGLTVTIQQPPTDIIDDIPWINWLVIPCLATIIGQDMAQRCFAAKSAKIVPYAMIAAATILVLATLLPAYLGIISYSLSRPIQGASVLIETVSFITNPYITSIFAAAILMAILSTADSILCALSSNIALDLKSFVKVLKKESINPKLVTVTIGIGSMIGSFFFEQIIPLMIISYEVVVATLFVPIIGAMILNAPQKKSAIASCSTSITAFSYFTIFTNYPYKAIVSIIIGLLAFICSQIILSYKKSKTYI
jgi:solute:Na+ symporter, SSS family